MKPRVSIRRWTLGVGIGIVVLSFSGCGNSNSATPSTLSSSFKSRVQAVCTKAANTFQTEGAFPYPNFGPAHPDVSDLPGIANYEAKTVANLRSWQMNLKDLGEADTAVWNNFLAAIDRNVNTTVAQQEAAHNGNSAAFTQTYDELISQASVATAAAKAAGVPSCDPGKVES